MYKIESTEGFFLLSLYSLGNNTYAALSVDIPGDFITIWFTVAIEIGNSAYLDFFYIREACFMTPLIDASGNGRHLPLTWENKPDTVKMIRWDEKIMTIKPSELIKGGNKFYAVYYNSNNDLLARSDDGINYTVLYSGTIRNIRYKDGKLYFIRDNTYLLSYAEGVGEVEIWHETISHIFSFEFLGNDIVLSVECDDTGHWAGHLLILYNGDKNSTETFALSSGYTFSSMAAHNRILLMLRENSLYKWESGSQVTFIKGNCTFLFSGVVNDAFLQNEPYLDSSQEVFLIGKSDGTMEYSFDGSQWTMFPVYDHPDITNASVNEAVFGWYKNSLFTTVITDVQYDNWIPNRIIAADGYFNKAICLLKGAYTKTRQNFSFEGNFTISFWIKDLLYSIDTEVNFMSFTANGLHIILKNSGRLALLLDDGSKVEEWSESIPADEWTHVILKRSAFNFYLKINRELVSNKEHTEISGEKFAIDSPFVLKQLLSNHALFLDEIAIFPYATTDNEDEAIFSNLIPKHFSFAPTTSREDKYRGPVHSADIDNTGRIGETVYAIWNYVFYTGHDTGADDYNIWHKGYLYRWNGARWVELEKPTQSNPVNAHLYWEAMNDLTVEMEDVYISERFVNKLQTLFSGKTHVPVGFIYFQLKGQKKPEELFTGIWEDISRTQGQYGGMFFRVEGGEATPFNNNPPSNNLTQPDQQDAIGFHDHYYNQPHLLLDLPIGTGLNRMSTVTDIINNQFISNGNFPYAAETRPVNTTIRIWKKVAE